MRKFSLWVVFILVFLIGSVVFIHWKTLEVVQQKAVRIQTLNQRQRVLGSLTLSLEKYRRMSGGFRKLEPEDVTRIKDGLRSAFAKGVTQLDQLNPTNEDRMQAHHLNEQLSGLLEVSARIEPMLFSRDAYQKPEVQELQNGILTTLSTLEKSNSSRITSLESESSRATSQSLGLLLGIGGVIFTLMICMIARGHFVYFRPLKRLYAYAKDLKAGKAGSQNSPHFSGMFHEIQSALSELAAAVENHMRDRHKFIVDVVTDLKAPLQMLQSGKYLLGSQTENIDEEKQVQAAESVRRGLAIFTGSLEDLNDIVDINRLESRLEEKTVDLAELLTDVSRTLMGSETAKRISISVPPMPVWASIDVARFERVFIHVLSKVMSTLPKGGNLAVSVAHPTQGNFRGAEIVIQDSERLKTGRPGSSGPEQDILKHWISENGLSMALAHKVVKAHGGTLTAAGVVGTSVSVTLRLPHERIVSRGLISPPTRDFTPGLRGALNQEQSQETSDDAAGKSSA